MMTLKEEEKEERWWRGLWCYLGRKMHHHEQFTCYSKGSFLSSNSAEVR